MLFLFQVTVLGYNHKLKILLETVIERIANFEVKPDRFSVIKVRLNSYHNDILKYISSFTTRQLMRSNTVHPLIFQFDHDRHELTAMHIGSTVFVSASNCNHLCEDVKLLDNNYL